MHEGGVVFSVRMRARSPAAGLTRTPKTEAVDGIKRHDNMD